MLPQVKTELRPLAASSQVKTASLAALPARKASRPTAEATRMPTSGRPLRSM
jgi:hypothetical protein